MIFVTRSDALSHIFKNLCYLTGVSTERTDARQTVGAEIARTWTALARRADEAAHQLIPRKPGGRVHNRLLQRRQVLENRAARLAVARIERPKRFAVRRAL
jgi:hypothetical protein